MSDLLGIGASGVSAYRTALATIGDNVANAETPGYARRSLSLKNGVAGGVRTDAVVRAWDSYKTSEARVSLGEAGRAEVRARWLGAAESALPDGDNGLAAKLTGAFTAADALAADPNGTGARNGFLAAIDEAAGALRTSADALARTADGIAQEAQVTVTAINGDLAALDKVNAALHRAQAGGAAQASLIDERDTLIDTLSANVAIETTIAANGTAEVRLAGSGGAVLLDGTGAATIAAKQAGNGRIALSVTRSGTSETASPTGGAIAGLVDVSSTVADRRAQLDEVATKFAGTINGWQAGGTDAHGAAGAPLLTITDGKAASLTLATLDPDLVAAASDGKANGNLARLQTLRAGGGEETLAGLISDQAQLVAAANAQAAATGTRRDTALASRDETIGVDLDREAAELLRYQQAYEGSARVIQVARETLQSILNLF